MIGKKVETSNKAVPARERAAPKAPRSASAGATPSDPPMDVDPSELIPSAPPAAPAAQANGSSVAIADADLEDDSATLMFKRPEPPPGPPRRPPPPKAKPAAPPAKPAGKPPLPAPTRVAQASGGPKGGVRAAPPPAKPVAKPPPPVAKTDKGPLAAPAANLTPSVEPKLSERPLFEVTLGSEKPLLATPEANEISLLAPKAPGAPFLAAPAAGEVGSLDLKSGAASPLPALPMLDFSRDISTLSRSAPPTEKVASRVVGFARAQTKWLVMTGATALIATASWMVFHAAAAGSDSVATAKTRAPIVGAHTLAAGPVTRTGTTQPAMAAQPVSPPPVAAAAPTAPADPSPVAAPTDPDPSAKAAEAPAAAAPPPPENKPAENTARPAAAAAEATAPAERHERPAPVAAAEPAARSSTTTRSTATSSHPSEPTTELPPAKAAPAPVPPPAAPTAPPSVGGFESAADFDQGAAMAALRQAAETAKRCNTGDAPSGGVRIAVTFARPGTVSATQVEGSAAGTPLGDCVAAKFQGVHVPPFRGSPMTVRKTVLF